MTPTRDRVSTKRAWHTRTSAVLICGIVSLSACGGGGATSDPTSPGGTGATTSAANSDQVLPVDSNPIANTSTAQALTIDSVLVENNVDPTTGKDASDHLEIALSNTGTTELTGFEVFYTYHDPTDGITESYYAALPDTFTIPAGGSRVAHFDNTGAPDHFPENQFSLYHTSMNAMDVTVEVSAADAAPQTMTVKKDKGGEEVAD